MKKVNPNKILSTHPVTGELVDLKWFRGASRYNNGTTLYGKKYVLRYLIGRSKEIRKEELS